MNNMFIYFEDWAYAVTEAEICSLQDGDRRAVSAADVQVQRPESQED